MPILMSKVILMGAGERAYEGDLVMTRNLIYYFPHSDLIRRRIDNAANLSAVLMMGGGNLGAVLAVALNNSLRSSRQRDNSDIPKLLNLSLYQCGVWETRPSLRRGRSRIAAQKGFLPWD
jgi:hypothetical protein